MSKSNHIIVQLVHKCACHSKYKKRLYHTIKLQHGIYRGPWDMGHVGPYIISTLTVW